MLSADERAALTPLAWARIAFAAVFLIRTTALIRLIDPAIGTEVDGLLGWPREGQFHAALLGIVLPSVVIKLLCLLRTVAALALLVGYRPLASGLAAGLAAYVVMMQDVFTFTFTQHLLFVGSVVVGVTDCAAVLSVRPEAPVAPKTSFYLVWAFVTSIYFWAAIGKFRWDWVDGRTLGLFYDEGKLRGVFADFLMASDGRRAVAGTLVVLTELALIPLLWTRRTRRVGLLVALGLHVVIEQVARPDVFGWAMIALLLSFVPMSERRASAAQGVQSA